MVAIVSPTGKQKVLPPVHPSEGVEAEYRRRLDAMIVQMHASIAHWLTAAYRANEPEMAADGSPAAEINAAMRRLARRWQRRFDALAPKLAKHFAAEAAKRSDAGLKAALRKAGFTVQFKLTAPMNDVLQATTMENVSLIRSIGAEHLADVQQQVMRSVAAGRDLGTLAKGLEERYGVTKRRAALISRDQNNKATAVITRVRQTELGITQARWVHSAGGRHPRPSHVKAGRDGLIYDVATGAEIDGEWIRPGELIGCRCVSRSIVPGFS